jgi:hypothetical protein
MYSGPVAAHALIDSFSWAIETIVLVRAVAFCGVRWRRAVRARRLSTRRAVSPGSTSPSRGKLLAATPIVREDRGPHRRSTRSKCRCPSCAGGAGINHRPAVDRPSDRGNCSGVRRRTWPLSHGSIDGVWSRATDLSHYENATIAHGLDAVVLEHVRRFDPDGLQSSLEKNRPSRVRWRSHGRGDAGRPGARRHAIDSALLWRFCDVSGDNVVGGRLHGRRHEPPMISAGRTETTSRGRAGGYRGNRYGNRAARRLLKADWRGPLRRS